MPDTTDEFRQAKGLLAVSSTLLVGCLIWLTSGILLVDSSSPAPPQPAASARSLQEPSQVAASFLSLIKLEHWRSARSLLSTRAQDRFTPEEFERRLSLYFREEDNRWDLRFRKVTSESRDEKRCTVTLRPARGEGRAWRWVLEQQEHGHWRLDKVQGLLD